MPKPRIFINIHYLEIGGAELALIGLLQALDPKQVDVDLFVNAHRGEMMQFIPEWVNLLPEIKAYSVIESPITYAIKKCQLGVAYGRWRARRSFRKYHAENQPIDGSAIFGYVGKYVNPHLPSLKRFGHYDLAISFLTPHNVVLDKVDAAKKLCWIHTDYTRIDVNPELELPVWDGYDHVVSISPDVTKTFLQVFPSLKGKIIEIENILSPEFIRSRADAEPRPADMPAKPGVINLLTIGRYCYPKRLDEVPAILRGIRDLGVDAEWYIIGYGSDAEEQLIRDNAAKEGVADKLHILGKRTNPYPYIKACDWYVQPSRYEGKSITVREAQILCRPVIITAYPTAPSQVTDGVDGIIIPLDLPSLIPALAAALTSDPALITTHLSTHDYGNTAESHKILNLID